MPYFKAKMHQSISSGALHRPRPRWWSLSAPPDPLAAMRGPTCTFKKEQAGSRGVGLVGRPPEFGQVRFSMYTCQLVNALTRCQILNSKC